MAEPVTIDPRKLFVWVHTWHGRPSAHREPTLRSLDLSDARGRYEVICQPEGADKDEFYIETLTRIAHDPDVQWMVRLEDDVVVNRNLIHNVSRWDCVREPLFGAGWLSVTNDLLADKNTCRRTPRGNRYREYRECHFSGGVLMSTETLRAALPLIPGRLSEEREGFACGCAPSNAAWRMGKRVFFHEPPIVAIDMTIPPHGKGYGGAIWSQPYSETWRAAP
jgi:hypothetical protein